MTSFKKEVHDIQKTIKLFEKNLARLEKTLQKIQEQEISPQKEKTPKKSTKPTEADLVDMPAVEKTEDGENPTD